MPKVYLSPSMQGANVCTFGDTEKAHCNAVMDLLEKHLTRCGIEHKRNTKLSVLSEIAADSNAYNPDLHFALHTNAVGGTKAGTVRGHHVYYYPSSADGKRMANLLVKNHSKMYSVAGAQNEAIGNSAYTEVKKTKAIAVIEETVFHDNIDDAKWYHAHYPEVAEYCARTICEYLGVPYVEETPSVDWEAKYNTEKARADKMEEAIKKAVDILNKAL